MRVSELVSPQLHDSPDQRNGTLFFAGGHGWHYERNIAEAQRLAEVLGYSEGITLEDPEDNSTANRCTVVFSDGRTEVVSALQAHKLAADPEVISVISEWQQQRAEQLLGVLDEHTKGSNNKVDVIANSASTLTVALALHEAVGREAREGVASPFGNVVLAYPAGLIKKASRFEDQKRVLNRAKESMKNRVRSRETEQTIRGARRKIGRESILAVVRKGRSMRDKAKTATVQMRATGGVVEQASAAVSLHTNILRQLGEMNTWVNLVLGDKDVMFPAQHVLESLRGGVNTVLVTDTNHGWGKPGRHDAVEEHYAELSTSQGAEHDIRLVAAEGVRKTRLEQLQASLGRRAI